MNSPLRKIWIFEMWQNYSREKISDQKLTRKSVALQEEKPPVSREETRGAAQGDGRKIISGKWFWGVEAAEKSSARKNLAWPLTMPPQHRPSHNKHGATWGLRETKTTTNQRGGWPRSNPSKVFFLRINQCSECRSEQCLLFILMVGFCLFKIDTFE